MAFPFDSPIIRFLYSLINTPGLGGLAVGGLAMFGVLSAAGALRWIIRGDQPDELETYAYPTPTLHEHPGNSAHSSVMETKEEFDGATW